MRMKLGPLAIDKDDWRVVADTGWHQYSSLPIAKGLDFIQTLKLRKYQKNMADMLYFCLGLLLPFIIE